MTISVNDPFPPAGAPYRPTAPRAVLVAAAASGQGKTTVTAALARRLRQDGMRVAIFKVGMDFIDPMLLAHATGEPVEMLDLWMVGEAACRQRLQAALQRADVVLVEGMMGLYDGTPSGADLAQRLGLPVLAVLDVSAMAQSAGALAMGLRDYGPVTLAGVVANRVAGAGHAAMVARSLRDIPLLASLPAQEMALPERHLGLMLPEEIAWLDACITRAAEQLVWHGEGWRALPVMEPAALAMASESSEPSPFSAAAAAAPSASMSTSTSPSIPMPADPSESLPRLLAGRTIAIARDAAFAFLYPANLDCLWAMGARLHFFSPLRDEPVPDDADAIWLPGGYPELHAERLSTARRWQGSICAAHACGMPIWAECGGMMAVCDSLTDGTGRTWPMAGLLPAQASMQGRLAGIGPQSLAWPDDSAPLRGHAFHYGRLDDAPAPALHTRRHPDGTPGEPLFVHGGLRASWFHAWFASSPRATAALFSTAGGA